MDQYGIAADVFRRTLRHQRASRMKGGIYHLTQVEMAYNSNRIEGSQLTRRQTRSLYETATIDGFAHVNDVIETTNSFRALDWMIDNIDHPVTAADLKELHRILKAGTQDADIGWFNVGDWKAVANAVGGAMTTPPALVDDAINALLQRTPKKMTFEDIVRFHHDFEAIHPFQDGNGRVGRLVMFGQCLVNDIMPFIVLNKDKAFYYRGLAEFDENPGYLSDTLRHFQDRYYQKYKDFVPLAGA